MAESAASKVAQDPQGAQSSVRLAASNSARKALTLADASASTLNEDAGAAGGVLSEGFGGTTGSNASICSSQNSFRSSHEENSGGNTGAVIAANRVYELRKLEIELIEMGFPNLAVKVS